MTHIVFNQDCSGTPRDIIVKQYTEIIENHASSNDISHRKSYSIIIDVVDFNVVLDNLEKFGTVYYVSSRGYVCLVKDGIVLVNVINRKEYINLYFEIFGPNKLFLDDIINKIYTTFQSVKKDAITIDICWYYNIVHGLRNETVREILDDDVLPENYPFITNLDKFIDDYIKSNEQILLLMGEPGTGKTRLVRHILKKMSYNKKEKSDIVTLTGILDTAYDSTNADLDAIYTTDSKTLENDELIISFLTEPYDVMILEDMDFNLKSRSEGNTSMYRLLASSDGVLTNRDKKIIISTNVDSESKIDDALIRPGRCFSIIKTRKLKSNEGNAILKRLNSKHTVDSVHTLAEIYKIYNCGSLDNTSVRKIGF